MRLLTKNIGDIKEHKDNPRFNEGAVDKVLKSIEQCGYISPIIIDEAGEILAGHTRYKALLRLGRTEIECVQIDGLTDEQKRKFRILDNKTGELAEWDYNLLALEKEGLDFGGVDFWEDDITMDMDAFGEEFSLPEGDQSEWRTMTFTLSAEQYESILYFIDNIESEDEFDNRDETANKIYEACVQWEKQRMS